MRAPRLYTEYIISESALLHFRLRRGFNWAVKRAGSPLSWPGGEALLQSADIMAESTGSATGLTRWQTDPLDDPWVNQFADEILPPSAHLGTIIKGSKRNTYLQPGTNKAA